MDYQMMIASPSRAKILSWTLAADSFSLCFILIFVYVKGNARFT